MTSLSLVALLWVSQVNSAECVNAYGMTRCGYDCIASYGQIACAQTPWGACHAAYGQVVCADPPPSVLWRQQGEIPKMECLASYGQIRCGYRCIAAYGQLQCAQTPWGACHAAYGQVQCFEAPPVGRRFRRHLFP